MKPILIINDKLMTQFYKHILWNINGVCNFMHRIFIQNLYR